MLEGTVVFLSLAESCVDFPVLSTYTRVGRSLSPYTYPVAHDNDRYFPPHPSLQNTGTETALQHTRRRRQTIHVLRTISAHSSTKGGGLRETQTRRVVALFNLFFEQAVCCVQSRGPISRPTNALAQARLLSQLRVSSSKRLLVHVFFNETKTYF